MPHSGASQIDRLAYPFAPIGMSDSERSEFTARLVEYHERFHLRVQAHELVRLASVFAGNCGPAAAPAPALRAGALFMYALSVLNEEVRLGSVRDQITSLQSGLYAGNGGSSEAKAGAWYAAGAELRALLMAHSGALGQARFLTAFSETLSAFTWESSSLGAWPRSRVQYWSLRDQTIAVAPFMELWKALCGISDRSHTRLGPPFTRIEQLSRELQFIANDLSSLHIDTSSEQQNAVLWLNAEGSGLDTFDAAAEALFRMHERKALVLEEELGFWRDMRPHDEDCQWWIRMVQGCTWGNLLAMRDLRQRYEVRSA